MTAQIIPFPARPDPEVTRLMYLTMSPPLHVQNECTEYVHFFDSKNMPCRCGQEVWPEAK